MTRRTGFIAAIAAFVLWGSLPVYWARIAMVPSLEVLGHRILWGGILSWAIVLLQRSRPRVDSNVAVLPLLPRGRTRAWLLVNGILVVANWYVYVWAVANGRTLDASLGYYINPLVSVFLGMVFLGERLTRMQWAALASAAAGVLYLTISLGVFPWISLFLAFAFGTYGLIKKRVPVSSIHGLAVEILPTMAVALAYLVVIGVGGTGSFLAGDPMVSLFLWGAGVVTVLPLLLFGIAARRIRLADVGFMQYIAPTMMFVIALVVFGDPLEPARLVGFGFVWFGLVLYTVSNVSGSVMRRRAAAPPGVPPGAPPAP